MDPARIEAARKARVERKKSKDCPGDTHWRRNNTRFSEVDVPLDDEEQEKINKLDELFKQAVQRKLAQGDDTTRFEKALQRVWRRVAAQKHRDKVKRDKHRLYFASRDGPGVQLSQIVGDESTVAVHSHHHTEKKEVGSTEYQKHKEVGRIVTIRVDAGYYIHVVDERDCLRVEEGPQIVILAAGDRVVRQNFVFTANNTSNKAEHGWVVAQPNINIGFSAVAETKSSIGSHSFQIAGVDTYKNHTFSADTNTSQLQSYSLPTDYVKPSYSLPIDHEKPSYSLPIDYAKPSYSLPIDNAKPSYSLPTQTTPPPSYSILDTAQSMYSPKLTAPNSSAPTAGLPKLTRADAIYIQDEMERIKNVFSQGFISEQEYNRRMDEVTDGKWQTPRYDTYLKSIIDTVDKQQIDKTKANLPTPTSAPAPQADGTAPPRGKKAAARMEKARKKIEYEEQKKENQRLYEERQKLREERQKLYEARQQQRAPRGRPQTEEEHIDQEEVQEERVEEEHVTFSSTSSNQKISIRSCDEVVCYLQTLLPRDGDYSYLSSSHFTTDDEDDYAVSERTKRREKNKRKKKAKSQRILRHSVNIFLLFADLGIVPPTTLGDVDNTISEVTELKTRYNAELEHQRTKRWEEENRKRQERLKAQSYSYGGDPSEIIDGDTQPSEFIGDGGADGSGDADGEVGENETNKSSAYSVDGESENGEAPHRVRFADNEEYEDDDGDYSLFE